MTPHDWYHVAGGCGSAILVMIILHWKWKALYVIPSAILMALSGFVLNGLWELIADTYHWLPSFIPSATRPDFNDVLRGLLGSAVWAALYLAVQIFRRKE